MSLSFAGTVEPAMAAASAESAAPAAETTAQATGTAAADASSAAGTATTEQAAGTGQEAAASTEVKAADQSGKGKSEAKLAAPPEDKWPTILANARTKERETVEASYAWAKGIPEQHRQTVGRFYGLLDAQPARAAEVVIANALADPQHAPAMRSMLGRLLGNGRRVASPDSADVDLEPDFSGQTQDGASVPLYSADKVKALVAHEVRRALSQVDQKLSPYEQERKARDVAERERARKQAADEEADQLYARVSKWRGFAENEQEIATAMAADDTLDVAEAYQQVVVPKLDRQAKVDVVAAMKDKSTASAINPAQATAAQTRPKTFREGFAQLPASAWGR